MAGLLVDSRMSNPRTSRGAHTRSSVASPVARAMGPSSYCTARRKPRGGDTPRFSPTGWARVVLSDPGDDGGTQCARREAPGRFAEVPMQYGLFTMPSHPPERRLYDG